MKKNKNKNKKINTKGFKLDGWKIGLIVSVLICLTSIGFLVYFILKNKKLKKKDKSNEIFLKKINSDDMSKEQRKLYGVALATYGQVGVNENWLDEDFGDNLKKIGIKLVDEIQKVRAKNNKNWMDLLKLSLTLDFKKTSKILKDIVSDDKKISTLARKIYNIK